MKGNLLNNMQNKKRYYFKDNYESWKTSFSTISLCFPYIFSAKFIFWIFAHFWCLIAWQPLTVETSVFFYQLDLDPGFVYWKQQITAYVNIAAIIYYSYALFWGKKAFLLLPLPTRSANAIVASTSI